MRSYAILKRTRKDEAFLVSLKSWLHKLNRHSLYLIKNVISRRNKAKNR